MRCPKCQTEIEKSDVSINEVTKEFGIDLVVICSECDASAYTFINNDDLVWDE